MKMLECPKQSEMKIKIRSRYGSGVRLEKCSGVSLAVPTDRDEVLNPPDKQQSSNSVL